MSERSDVTNAVDHPDHYGGEANLYECIKVIEAWGLDFCLGNSLKYISRAGRKVPVFDALPPEQQEMLARAAEVEDLKKARWYLDRRIQQVEVAEVVAANAAKVAAAPTAASVEDAADAHDYPLPDHHALEELGPPQQGAWPYREGDILVLGPEVIATLDRKALSWRGEHYIRLGA